MDPAELVQLRQLQVLGGESEKLPGVRSPRQIWQFLVRVDRFEAVSGQISGIDSGSDGQRHDRLLLPIEQAIRDGRRDQAYRSTLQNVLPRITG